MAVRLPTRHIQEIKILLVFIKHAGLNGSIDTQETDFLLDLNNIVENGYNLDVCLYELNNGGILNYDEIGDDGFAPIVLAGLTKNTHAHLSQLIFQFEQEAIELERQLKELLTFDPEKITAQIEEAQEQLRQAKTVAESNALLKPILQPIADIQRHFESVVAVSGTYENIYKNIIRPVQREGEAGVKATVRWAIISIVLSTFLSVAIGNWNELTKLWETSKHTLHTTQPVSDIDVS